MTRTPEQLAAIASAAVPLLSARAVGAEPDDPADFDAAIIRDGAGRSWRVRSPKHPEASLRLENELTVLRSFTPAIRADLPFELPTVAGTVRQGPLTTFVYSHLPGSRLRIDDVRSRTVAPAVGRALAAVHALPHELIEDAGLPAYTANEFRQRRLNELDQAATTSRIPSTLLRRWENALEDVSLWRFAPTVVHGDLHEDHVLVDGDRVTAVSGWTDLHVGDPADDFAWLVACNDRPFVEVVQEAYSMALSEPEDAHLMHRAALSAEFALAQWLVRGVTLEDHRIVDEAEQMLRDLAHDVETTGGWRLTNPPPVEVPISDDVPLAGSSALASSGSPGDADAGTAESEEDAPGGRVPGMGEDAEQEVSVRDSPVPGRPTAATRVTEPDAVTTRHPVIAHQGPAATGSVPLVRRSVPPAPPSVPPRVGMATARTAGRDERDPVDDERFDAPPADERHADGGPGAPAGGRLAGATAVRKVPADRDDQH